MTDTPRPCALLIEDDLFFAARILSVLEHMGYRAESADTPERAQAKAASDAPELAIINLASARLIGIETARALKTAGVPHVLAYLSHVRIPEVRDVAREAGIERLCANSAITRRLPEIVQSIMAGRPATDEDGE